MEEPKGKCVRNQWEWKCPICDAIWLDYSSAVECSLSHKRYLNRDTVFEVRREVENKK